MMGAYRQQVAMLQRAEILGRDQWVLASLCIKLLRS